MEIKKTVFFLLFLSITTPMVSGETNFETIGDLFAQATESIEQLNLIHDALEDPEEIAAIDALIEHLQCCLQELEALDPLELRPNDEGQDGELTPEQIIQANQQQIINDLINAIDQSNETIEKLTSKSKWKYIKIGLYVAGGALALAGVTVLGYYAYTKIRDLVSSPFEEIDNDITEKLEKTEDLGEKVIEKATELKDELEPLKKNTKLIKRGVKKGLKVLKQTIEEDIPEMKRKLDDKIMMFQLLSEIRELREKENTKIAELEEEIKHLKEESQTKDRFHDREISKLKRELSRESLHMKNHSMRLGYLLENDLIVTKELMKQKRNLHEARSRMGMNASPVKHTEDRLKKVRGFGDKGDKK